MKIVRLTAENVKKLQAVEIDPQGNVVVVAGKNGAGKSSILDSIWWALAGASNIQAQPIRQGETKARIRLDLGNLVVERKFTSSGSTLVVESADGARYPSPQKMLDALIGELSFDPLAFARAEPRKQFDELRRVAKLELDVDALALQNKGDFTKRTEINRQAKQKRAAADLIQVPDGLPAEPIDEAAIVDAMQRAGEENAELEARKARRESVARDVADKRREAQETSARAETAEEVAKARADELVSKAAEAAERAVSRARQEAAELREKADRLEREAAETERAIREQAQAEAEKARSDGSTQAAELRAAAQAAIETADALQQKLDTAPALPSPVDVSGLRDQLEQAKTVNAGVARRMQRGTLEVEAQALEAQASALTDAIEERERQKAAAIKAAALPVESLGFGDGCVTYNGVPFEQASSAEQLRVSLAIAMAANPKLRVIRIQDGSLLDDENMAAIAEMAVAGDYQVWIERVDASGTVGIVIEDGHVRGSEAQKEVPAA